LFGSPELFFASVFCSQGSRKLSDMTTGELKKLFGEFLKLEILTQHEDTAKQCTNILSSQSNSIDRELEVLKDLADDYPATRDKLIFLKGTRAGLEQNLLELSKKLEESEAALTTAQSDIQKNELI